MAAVNPVVQTVTQPMTQPMNPMEGQLIQMPEQLFMDSFPVAEPVAQPITLQKVQPVGNENNEDFKKRLFNRINQLFGCTINYIIW